MVKRILVPTDGFENSEKAGEYAISIADVKWCRYPCFVHY